jgi:hypothetical protein
MQEQHLERMPTTPERYKVTVRGCTDPLSLLSNYAFTDVSAHPPLRGGHGLKIFAEKKVAPRNFAVAKFTLRRYVGPAQHASHMTHSMLCCDRSHVQGNKGTTSS